MEYVSLNNGVKMPMVGLGTHGISNDQLASVIPLAYELGYTKFDTAWLYGNEEIIGNALRNNRIDREKVFLTSKLHINDLYWGGYRDRFFNIKKHSIAKALDLSCKRLKTDYLDLYLIHWPFPHYEGMWEELERLYEKGRIKAIGVSSFLPQHIDRILPYLKVIPAVNQFEVNPFNTQVEETEYCQERGIHVEAYATFGTTKSEEKASRTIIENPNIVALAQKYNKTTSQIILRWAVQRGISVIPRSKSRAHLQENLNIFDFILSDNDMKVIDGLNQNKYSRGNPHNTL